MTRPIVVVLYLALMTALIIGVDMAFLRHHFWARLIVNVAIVAVFAAGYFRFLR